MSCRKILLVYGAEQVGDLVRRFLQAEMSDLEFDEAGSADGALVRLREEKYNLVLCARGVDDQLDPQQLSARMRADTHNSETPFLILTRRTENQDFLALVRQGLGHFLPMPFTPRELADQVNAAADPRAQRRSERVHLPGTEATIHFGESDVRAQVINLSGEGMLCEFPCLEKCGNLVVSVKATIHLSSEAGGKDLGPLPARLLRLNVLRFRENEQPASVRAAYHFYALPPAATVTLNRALGQARAGEEKRATSLFSRDELDQRLKELGLE